jgi:hypothetical protein
MEPSIAQHVEKEIKKEEKQNMPCLFSLMGSPINYEILINLYWNYFEAS